MTLLYVLTASDDKASGEAVNTDVANNGSETRNRELKSLFFREVFSRFCLLTEIACNVPLFRKV